jgi:hypothetical protein
MPRLAGPIVGLVLCGVVSNVPHRPAVAAPMEKYRPISISARRLFRIPQLGWSIACWRSMRRSKAPRGGSWAAIFMYEETRLEGAVQPRLKATEILRQRHEALGADDRCAIQSARHQTPVDTCCCTRNPLSSSAPYRFPTAVRHLRVTLDACGCGGGWPGCSRPTQCPCVRCRRGFERRLLAKPEALSRCEGMAFALVLAHVQS